jgi:hypothetical protein
MSNNPFAKHTSNLFGSRGCDIDQALIYANEVISAMPGEVQAHATTALMVVVNTAANAFAQSQGPSPEKQIAAAWVRELVAQEIEKQSLQTSAVETVIGWLSDNLDDRLDDWANNSMGFDDAVAVVIDRWIENNLDVSSQVSEALDDLDLSDRIEGAINDMDLVVRVR